MQSKNTPVFNLILCLSLLYIIYFLAKSDLLHFPEITNISHFVVSLSFLILGTIFLESYSWHRCIKNAIPNLSLKDSISASGMTVFGKYLPGKFWGIAGRSDYISKKYNYNLGDILNLSLNFQVLIIWVGLIFGLSGLIILKVTFAQLNYFAYLAIFLSFGFFSKKFQSYLIMITSKLFKRNIRFVSPSEAMRLMPIVVLSWLILSLSFYFFVQSMHSEKITFSIGLIYPLGVIIGVLSLLVPGGLGVREGVFAFLLSSVGFSIEFSLTISIFSRLWSIMADIGFFLFSIFFGKFNELYS